MAPISTLSSSHVKTVKRSRFSRLCIHTCMGVILLALYGVNQQVPEISTEASFPSRANRVTSTPSPKVNDKPGSTSEGVIGVHNSKHEEGLSEYAREVLLAAARDRSKEEKEQQKQKGIRQTSNLRLALPEGALPPLESLVDSWNNEIKTDVQWLLDFAIMGFGKCGTTSLLQWLQQSPLVRAPSYEAQFLHNERPVKLVRKMYQFAIEEQEAKQTKTIGPDDKILKGFKNPSDIRRSKSREIIRQHWPKAPLIVTVRHPVKWLVSLYNYFKIEKGRHGANVTVADMLAPGGRDENGDTRHFVSTAKGEFHAMLAEVGKTPLKESDEWKLLQPWLNPPSKETIQQHSLPNPIFFMEMQQLADDNATRAQQFANDLETFLGLPPNHLPPVLHVRPNTDRVKVESTDHLKMDICSPEYAPVLQEMVAISRSASQWFRSYFIQSPDVTVSSPDYLLQLLDEWMVDPCDDNHHHQGAPQ